MKRLLFAALLLAAGPAFAAPDADHDADRAPSAFPVITPAANDNWILTDTSNSGLLSKVATTGVRAAIGLGTSDNVTFGNVVASGGALYAGVANTTQGALVLYTNTDPIYTFGIMPAASPSEIVSLKAPPAMPLINNALLNFDVDGTGGWTAPNTFEPAKGADDYFVTNAEKIKLSFLSGVNTGDQTTAGSLTVVATGFDGNLATTDNTVQEIAQKLDDLVVSGAAEVQDETFNATNFNADTTHAVSQDDVYDRLHLYDADDDGDFTDETWFPSTSGAPTNATYLTATTETGLSAEVNLGLLTTGLMKNTVAAGVATISTAAGGTDYLRPTTDVDDTPVNSETAQPVSSNWAYDHAATATSETVSSHVELATTAEVVTGTDTARAVTAAGVTAKMAAPGAIGGTTPAAGTFTTVTAATYASSAADGSRYSEWPNNTSRACTGGGVEESYNEAGALKACENDTEYDILLSRDIGGAVQAYDADLTTWAGVTPGTGIATALAVNVGSAGAPVLFNGAGGTPTSLNLTNALVNSGTSLPGTCSAGQLFIDTDADTNGQLYSCIATNTWKDVDDDGGAGGMATTDIDTSAEIRTIVGDESGTGALLFAGGDIAAGTATTPSANDNDTSVATTAYVQTEIAAVASDSMTLTNKTLSYAGTGNDLTMPLNGLLDFAITDPADADDLIFKKVQNALTLTDIHCLAEGGGTITVTYQECTTAGASCAAIEGAITADSDGAEDDGTLTDGSIAAGAWIKVLFSAPTGTVTNAACTVYGTQVW